MSLITKILIGIQVISLLLILNLYNDKRATDLYLYELAKASNDTLDIITAHLEEHRKLNELFRNIIRKPHEQ